MEQGHLFQLIGFLGFWGVTPGVSFGRASAAAPVKPTVEQGCSHTREGVSRLAGVDTAQAPCPRVK